ncbi:hypothetical protein TGME49_214160 [Toxoplasma gondii ME49]|uniref:Uncharacterized protein n=1 Tax=Toxoplasma gondii (strain ATCC 50611 / Me49) TaxID=508771 RepID=S8GDR6_TOXGM|nr:hypothetical protein TGME49_214160 [Toxoplasma gondii ME49]EPT26569.1 hypothetical protein TGME49_214160 [Toxoplasma gondii ME49]|eukprot:XP_002370749.1 hypothetical protein TGME49_214160 [Toxoplasma gondii ME49]
MLEKKDSLLHSFALFCSLLCPDSKLRFLQATVHLVNSCLGKVASTRSTALPLRRLSYLVSPRQSPLFSFFCSSVSLLLLPAFDSSLIVSLPLKTVTYRPTVSPAVSLSLLLCLSLSLGLSPSLSVAQLFISPFALSLSPCSCLSSLDRASPSLSPVFLVHLVASSPVAPVLLPSFRLAFVRSPFSPWFSVSKPLGAWTLGRAVSKRSSKKILAKTNKQTDRQTDRQTNRQTDRQTDRHHRARKRLLCLAEQLRTNRFVSGTCSETR